MQFYRRQLRQGETDHELIWFAVSLGSLGLATAWLALGLPWPRCAFHDLTGFPCATCGMTRCAIQFFHGHMLEALKWNPLVFTALCGVLAFDLYAVASLTMRAPRCRIALRQNEKKFARGIVIGAFALNWMYLLSHWRNF
jgi:Protein of unknown function (DUF2752)